MNHHNLEPGMLWRHKTSGVFRWLVKVEHLMRNNKLVYCEWLVGPDHFRTQSYFDTERFEEFQKDCEFIQ